MNQHEENVKRIKKFEDDVFKEFIDAAFEKIKEYIQELYDSSKDKIERAIVLSEDKNEKPIITSIPTKLTFKEIRSKRRNTLSIELKGEDKLGDDALTAAWHGTGLGIRKDILEYIFSNSKNPLPQSEESGVMSKYYLDPTNADMRFINSIKNAKIK